MRDHGFDPVHPLPGGVARFAARPGAAQVSQGVPLRTCQPAGVRDDAQRFAQFPRGVVLRIGVVNDSDTRVVGRDRLRVPMFDRLLIDLGDGPVEIDVLITSVEPPSGDLVSITVGPSLYALGPFSGELAQERLVRGASRMPNARWARASWLGTWQGR